MNTKLVEEILDELLPAIEAIEAQSTAVLTFLKDKKFATEDQLDPYLQQAANASSVRWRATRVRMERLLLSAVKEGEDPDKKTAATSSQKSSTALAPAQQETQREAHENLKPDAPKEKENRPGNLEGERKDAA